MDLGLQMYLLGSRKLSYYRLDEVWQEEGPNTTLSSVCINGVIIILLFHKITSGRLRMITSLLKSARRNMKINDQ